MALPIQFLGGEIILADRGLKRFETFEDLLRLAFVPPGAVSGAQEIRLAGIDDQGSPFHLVFTFDALHHGSLPPPQPVATRRPPGQVTRPAAHALSAIPQPSAPPAPVTIPSAAIATPMAPPAAAPTAQTPAPPAGAPLPHMQHKVRIGDLLMSLGLLTQQQLDIALAEQKKGGKRERLGIILQRLGFISPKVLYKALARQFRTDE